MNKYDIIVNAEQQFAREVTLGVIVTHPLTTWHYIIPGFFVIDFLRRGSAIRQYTKHYMFPRKLALDVARDELQGENMDSRDSDLENDIEKWLGDLKLYTPDLVQAHLVLIEILAAHYLKLLKAEGDTFDLLIERAYQDRENFIQFVESVTAAENEVDRQVIELLGGVEKIKEKISAEQQQLAKRRQKIADDIF